MSWTDYQEDIRGYIDDSIKHGVQLSAFRREREAVVHRERKSLLLYTVNCGNLLSIASQVTV
ncbi:hypothetical protein Taro_041888 [Colocasia esculenta]|uniref:Uncharacterized protein n=1 Tax=Colocasia esculenta TaxID=4460 RepID=A0A843WH15_COLES|nr:hypothetical protein [Colocasia esculenta]